MFPLFKKTKIVDADTSQNIRECFEWAINNFDREYFYKSTVLVHPTREYFPDRAGNEFAMAQALCKRILSYAGLSDWPFKVVAPQFFSPQMPRLLNLNTQVRINQGDENDRIESALVESVPVDSAETSVLELSYSSVMMKKPIDLVGSMSKNVAQHYLYQSQLNSASKNSATIYNQLNSAPFFDASAEIVAIFMGFGVFIVNSAYTFRGSCAKCYDPRANRAAALSESEAIYCLALFCHYKQISSKKVLPSLKGYLRSSFKKARAQVKREFSDMSA